MKSWNRKISLLLSLCLGNPPVTSGFPHKGTVVQTSNASLLSVGTSSSTNTWLTSNSQCSDGHFTSPQLITEFRKMNRTFNIVKLKNAFSPSERSLELIRSWPIIVIINMINTLSIWHFPECNVTTNPQDINNKKVQNLHIQNYNPIATKPMILPSYSVENILSFQCHDYFMTISTTRHIQHFNFSFWTQLDLSSTICFLSFLSQKPMVYVYPGY